MTEAYGADSRDLPPVPYQFLVQPELYHMAVGLYIESIIGRAMSTASTENRGPCNPSVRHIISVLKADALALKEAKERGEPV